jgi:hypothetical protein
VRPTLLRAWLTRTWPLRHRRPWSRHSKILSVWWGRFRLSGGENAGVGEMRLPRPAARLTSGVSSRRRFRRISTRGGFSGAAGRRSGSVLSDISARAGWGATAAMVGGSAAVGRARLSLSSDTSGCFVCTASGVTSAVAGPYAGSGVGLRFFDNADSASGRVAGVAAADSTAPVGEGDASSGRASGSAVGTAAFALMADAKTGGLATAGLDGAAAAVRMGIREGAGRGAADEEAAGDRCNTAVGVDWVGGAASSGRASGSQLGLRLWRLSRMPVGLALRL